MKENIQKRAAMSVRSTLNGIVQHIIPQITGESFNIDFFSWDSRQGRLNATLSSRSQDPPVKFTIDAVLKQGLINFTCRTETL